MAVKTLGANKSSKELTVHDRCDACGGQAYVWVNGVTGDLLFCGHHYTKIMSNPVAKKAMENFAFETLDNRDKLSTKRAGL